MFRVYSDTLNAKQESPRVMRERDTERTTLLIERATAVAACGFFFLFLFVHITNARECIIVPGGGGV